ncbi:hypothetical protein ACFQ0M_45195 [Kitasatospora aburaviensis]
MTDQRKGSYTVPEEFGELVAEFRGLLEKYPGRQGSSRSRTTPRVTEAARARR